MLTNPRTAINKLSETIDSLCHNDNRTREQALLETLKWQMVPYSLGALHVLNNLTDDNPKALTRQIIRVGQKAAAYKAKSGCLNNHIRHLVYIGAAADSHMVRNYSV